MCDRSDAVPLFIGLLDLLPCVTHLARPEVEVVFDLVSESTSRQQEGGLLRPLGTPHQREDLVTLPAELVLLLTRSMSVRAHERA